MARIVAVAPALPEHVYSQQQITDVIAPMLTADPSRQAVLRRLHGASRVDTRHLVMPIERYRDATTFTESNGKFIEAAANLTSRALADALAASGLEPEDVDYLMFTSVTGISAPSIDAMVMARLGLRADVKRVPMYGLGCVAGAAGIARVDDYLVGHPDDVAVLLAVELCSLTFQPGDDSTANLVATGLFGDGAAAVVMVGDARAAAMEARGVEVVDTRSRLYPDTEGVIGFNASETGFRIVLTAQVSDVIEGNFGRDTAGLLADNGLDIADVDTWVAHPGGPKVLDSFRASLGLSEHALDRSWESLARVGNLSSVSVLDILATELAEEHAPGSTGLLFALGPGVSAELVLLRWA
ncbi:MAG: type polyketide synthase [Microbacteriaceae bacterium]|nr:type polyketide synthase [Microbacteriaceae bacterium]